MKKIKLSETGSRGWFVGPFENAAIYSKEFELAIADWPVGPIPKHYHSNSTEAIVILSGRCITHGIEFSQNEMFILEPGDINDSNFLEPSKILAIKMPAGANDKVSIN
jgi:hypothetical protein